MKKIKEVWQKAKRERWIQHFVLFFLLALAVIWPLKPFNWEIYEVVLLSTTLSMFPAILFEMFQVAVSGSERYDVELFVWLDKLKVISLSNKTTISWSDVLASMTGFALGGFLIQLF